MPHWRPEAKENARKIRATDALIEALENCLAEANGALMHKPSQRTILYLSAIQEYARVALAKVKANSTEPVE